MATTTTAVTPGKYLDLDQTPIQGQTGWALLDLNGNVLVLSGSLPEANLTVLYQMLLETTSLVNDKDFRKLTVSFQSQQYLVSRDENHIYVVETTSIAT
ncbi:unnamed protein product [Cylindrotheca closterium]|uniref:Late endosomal/lysosomal adaptor and MAPK and MTOR activator 4 n=1 Tax=Cylindrotheca closterium TaxID=2856 RepID=A0AAD2PVG1_9STRA|nr:unnamed protein product [Cylindrotheca closterium]